MSESLLKNLVSILKTGAKFFRPCSDEMGTTTKPEQILEIPILINEF